MHRQHELVRDGDKGKAALQNLDSPAAKFDSAPAAVAIGSTAGVLSDRLSNAFRRLPVFARHSTTGV
jgi:hypothetical protein